MKTYIILFVVVLTATLAFPYLAQGSNVEKPRYTISGHIKEQISGEDLPGATIYIKEIGKGTVSNVYGFYSLSLPSGSYTLIFSYVGYQNFETIIDLNSDITLNVELDSKDNELEEVVISSELVDKNITRVEMSTVKLDIKTIRKIPAFMGEVDVIKAIQLLPGVQSISEGSSGFSVRGGSMDQNLIQLDEATVYNASHLMGFFSVFNNDAIKDVKLYKGDIPVSSGGRLSSLLDVRMKDGNSKKISGTGGIGTISSRLTLEGPIIKNRASFIVSARRTYADMFLKLSGSEALRNNKLHFYDINAKVNFKLNPNNRIYFSGYSGRDVYGSPDIKMDWGNQTVTTRWNHLFSKKLFSNFSMIYSNYDYGFGISEGSVNAYQWEANLQDYGAKGDFTFYLNTDNTITFGISTIYHHFEPGMATSVEDLEYNVPPNNALESGIYLGNEQKIGSRLIVKYGLRFSYFQNIGPAIIYNFDKNYEKTDSTVYGKGELFSPYLGLEPRLGAVYILNEKSSLKASYSKTRQYVHLAQNSTAGTPQDVWFPSSPNVKPQIANQGALGYFRNFSDNKIEVSVEGYYKYVKNAIDFKDYAELQANKEFEGELRSGTAQAYGLEFMVMLKYAKLNGWVSYTLSKTEKTIAGVNDGRPYPTTYDKPNDISIVLNYDLSSRTSFGFTWVYSTGAPATYPIGSFSFGNKIYPVYSDRNEYRMPDYHRLDISLTLRGKDRPGRKWHGEWNFSVYNAYARKNAWVVNFRQDYENPDKTYAEMTYLFGIIPAITYNFKF